MRSWLTAFGGLSYDDVIALAGGTTGVPTPTPTPTPPGGLTQTQIQALIDASIAASQVAPQPLSGALGAGDLFIAVRGSGLAATPYTVTQTQTQAWATGGTAPAAVAPSPVTSLAAGTPTPTTIPVTFTAPTAGTAPITYAGLTSVDGTTYTTNGGTFTASGGTFTGLTAATAYHLRVAATNSTGTATADVAGTVSTAAAAAKVGPDLVTTSATYATSPNGQALSGGSGTVALSLANGASRTIKARIFVPAAAHDVTLISLSNSLVQLTNGQLGGSFTGNNYLPAMATGWHEVHIEQDTVTNAPYGQTRVSVDGTGVYTRGDASQNAANPTLTVTPRAGVLLDELAIHSGIDSTALPAAGYPAGTAGLVGDWAFDGSGASR